jgi:hypothetical protein
MVAAMASFAMPAAAAGLDGHEPLTCETSETFDCAPNDECIKDSPEAVNLPRLIRLDFAGKRAFTKSASGEQRTAEIASQHVDGGKLILQGVQEGNAWSMAVSQETGIMSLTISGDQAAIVAFGVCGAF